MEPDEANGAVPEMEAPKPRSFFSRLGGVYSSPRDAFGEIGKAPGIWIPLIVLIALSLLAGYYLSQKIDMESMMVTQLENAVQQGRLTQEQMDQQLQIMTKFSGIQIIAMAGLSPIFMTLIIAGYAKLFSAFSGSENTFKSLFSVTIYSLLAISIIQSGLMILVLQLKGAVNVDPSNINSIVASNLGAMLTSVLGKDALPKFVVSLANFVDVFAIWTIALLSIGYSAVSKKLKTGTAAFWLVATYAVIALISATISSIFNFSGTA